MSTTRADIVECVRDLLVAVLSVAPADVVSDARLIQDLGAESIDLLDLRFRIEKAFGFKISDRDLAIAFGRDITPEEFRRRFTVAALCDYVERRLSGGNG